MTARAMLLSDEQIENDARRNCDNADELRVRDFSAGAFYARSWYAPELASAQGKLASASEREKVIDQIAYDLAVAKEREKVLEAFAKLGMWALETYRKNLGDLEGGEIRDAALHFGLLHEVDVTEPCCEECSCAEWDDFPQKCIRVTDVALEMVKEDGR